MVTGPDYLVFCGVVDRLRGTEPVPRRILLSYAREDAAVVAEMAADLRALDHEVWLDQDLGGGQDWWDEILADPLVRRLRACPQQGVA